VIASLAATIEVEWEQRIDYRRPVEDGLACTKTAPEAADLGAVMRDGQTVVAAIGVRH
jgi:hypothetical protein